MLALWLSILLSTILVFLMSAVLHMALRYHQTDYARLPDEDRAREALRSVPPGDYHVPHAKGMAELSNPEMLKKFEDGPVGLLTIRSSGSPSAMMNSLTVESLVVKTSSSPAWFCRSSVLSTMICGLTGLPLASSS